MRVPLALLTCLIAAFAIACSDDNGGSADGLPDADRVVADASRAVAGLRSFHFRLTQENATLPLPLNLNLDTAEGDVILPDRLKANLRTRAQGLNVSVDVIAIGPDTWITNPFTRAWQRQSADLREFADLSALLPSILPALRDPRVVRETEIDGVRTYQLEGTVASADLQQALPFSLPNREVKVEAWVGADDSLPRRVRVIGSLISGESGDAVRQVDLSRFDQPVTISPP